MQTQQPPPVFYSHPTAQTGPNLEPSAATWTVYNHPLPSSPHNRSTRENNQSDAHSCVSHRPGDAVTTDSKLLHTTAAKGLDNGEGQPRSHERGKERSVEKHSSTSPPPVTLSPHARVRTRRCVRRGVATRPSPALLTRLNVPSAQGRDRTTREGASAAPYHALVLLYPPPPPLLPP